MNKKIAYRRKYQISFYYEICFNVWLFNLLVCFCVCLWAFVFGVKSFGTVWYSPLLMGSKVVLRASFSGIRFRLYINWVFLHSKIQKPMTSPAITGKTIAIRRSTKNERNVHDVKTRPMDKIIMRSVISQGTRRHRL